MKVVFMGTPDFAVATLRALCASGHEVAGVFTRADTPKNRGMKMMPPPVKVEALAHNLPVFQPTTLRDGAALEILRSLKPDAIVVAAYGRILPREILEFPRHGCINVHASLLPRFRGASPIQAAILHGDAQSGVTIMQMADGIDTGDMLYVAATDIGSRETCGELEQRLADIGARALLETLALCERGALQPQKQDDARATHAPLIKNGDCLIDFSHKSDAVACAIRAYDPVPGAFAFLGGEKMKLYGAETAQESGEAGRILSVDARGARVACGEGSVLIEAVQGQGGKKMPSDAFFRGHKQMLSEKFVKEC